MVPKRWSARNVARDQTSLKEEMVVTAEKALIAGADSTAGGTRTKRRQNEKT